MSDELPFGTIHDLRPVFDAAIRADRTGLTAALDRLTDEEIAFICDVGEFLRLTAGLSLSARIAESADQKRSN
jgi:hypothetical protein